MKPEPDLSPQKSGPTHLQTNETWAHASAFSMKHNSVYMVCAIFFPQKTSGNSVWWAESDQKSRLNLSESFFSLERGSFVFAGVPFFSAERFDSGKRRSTKSQVDQMSFEKYYPKWSPVHTLSSKLINNCYSRKK
jgi:hypothetical protein